MPADLNDYFKKRNGGSGGDNNQSGGNNFNLKVPQFDGKKAIPFYIVIAIALLLIVARPFAIIDSGEMGIRVTTGVYSQDTLEPGLHFFVPFLQEIIIIDAKVRMMSYTSTEKIGDSSSVAISSIIQKESISVKDSRNLEFHIDLAVQYQLDRANVPNTIAEWGRNWENKIIDPTAREIVRKVASQYNAEDIQQKRNLFTDEIKTQITDKVNAQKGKPVNVLDVQLREIILPANIKEQIERVQITRQETERVRGEVARAEQEAAKRVTIAQGEAKAQIIAAEAQAEANQKIAKSLTPQLLELRQIDTQAKFNEALRENKDAQIFLTPGGAVPNIWVDTKNKQRQSSVGQ